MARISGKEVVRDLIDKVVNCRRLDLLEAYFDPEVVQRDLPPEQPEGITGIREAFARAFRAFPVLRVELDEMVEEGEIVSYKTTIRAITLAGRRVQLRGYAIDRVRNGKIVEHWESVLPGR